MSNDTAWADLRRHIQENRVNFLTVELDLAGTLCERAKHHPNPQRRAEILGKVEQAIETVRRFADKIEDPATRKVILDRADDVECRVEQ